MITPEQYREVMRNLASGVTIVTTRLDGKDYGMTATSFTSVSLDPLLVQVSLDKDSRTHEAVRAAGRFAVNILAEDQEWVAREFAQKGIDRFDNCEVVEGTSDLPLIEGCIGNIECRAVDELDGGDHTIFVGECLDARTSEGMPLLYFRGEYTKIQNERSNN